MESHGSSSSHIPGNIVSLVDSSVELLKVEVEICGKPVTAVVDTGAVKSLISSSLAAEINLPVKDEINS